MSRETTSQGRKPRPIETTCLSGDLLAISWQSLSSNPRICEMVNQVAHPGESLQCRLMNVTKRQMNIVPKSPKGGVRKESAGRMGSCSGTSGGWGEHGDQTQWKGNSEGMEEAQEQLGGLTDICSYQATYLLVLFIAGWPPSTGLPMAGGYASHRPPPSSGVCVGHVSPIPFPLQPLTPTKSLLI